MATDSTNDPNARWRLEEEPPEAAWRAAGKPILNALMEHVPTATDRRPWVPGYELRIQGQGRLVSKEQRRYTIVGHGQYSNHIGGCRTLTAGTQSIRTTEHIKASIGRSDDAPDRDVSWGTDRLHVKGNADLHFGSRDVIMSGIVNRTWHGGVMRLASMEGMICGGAFLRLIAGPAMTPSGMMTGDVYGGAARVSAVRSYLAVLQYRAASSAAWAAGVYVRNATFVIEPVVGTPSANAPVAGLLAKLARLAKVLAVVRMLCPVIDILIGLFMLVPMGLAALAGLIAGIVKTPNPVPPSGPPRMRTQNIGLHQSAMASAMHL